jgi:hypothetical protein
MTRVLVTGDRNWSCALTIERALITVETLQPPGTQKPHLMHGGCRGADSLAGLLAQKRGWLVTSMPAEWSVYGKAAGPIRNRSMLEQHQPQVVLIFHDSPENSRGTKDCLELALKCQPPPTILWFCSDESDYKQITSMTDWV